MRWLFLFALVLAGGCGESYVAPQAATRVELTSIADLNTAYANLKAHILAQGFEQAPDKPVPDFMLEHHSAGMRWRLVHTEHFSRERGGLLDRESAFIQLTPYPDVSTGYQIANGYNDATPHWPFLEVHVLESRPDGFSPRDDRVLRRSGAVAVDAQRDSRRPKITSARRRAGICRLCPGFDSARRHVVACGLVHQHHGCWRGHELVDRTL